MLAAEHFPESRIQLVEDSGEIWCGRRSDWRCLHWMERILPVRPIEPLGDAAVMLLGFDTIVGGIKDAMVPRNVGGECLEEKGDAGTEEPSAKDRIEAAADKPRKKSQAWLKDEPARGFVPRQGRAPQQRLPGREAVHDGRRWVEDWDEVIHATDEDEDAKEGHK